MTKMAAIPIYGKMPLKILFPGTRGTITKKHGMKQKGLHHIIVCSSYDPVLNPDLFFGKVKFWNLNFT